MRPSATRLSATKPKAPETLHLSASQEALRIQVIPAEVIGYHLYVNYFCGYAGITCIYIDTPASI
jgi:hypothetical protein